MKKITSIIILFLCVISSNVNAFGQSFNSDRMELSNFLTRMYKAEPFDGVRVITDYDNTYLMSTVTLSKSKYPSMSATNRVASVKAMSQASQYFNGSSISTEIIINTSEHSDGTADVEIIEKIQENSAGYIKALEQLTNFDDKNGNQVFIFIKQIL